MRVLVIGGGGMLGHKLVQVFSEVFDVWTTIRSEFAPYEKIGLFKPDQTFELLDAENFGTFEDVISKIKPEVIVNAIGIIKQLPTAKDTIKVLNINSIFPHKLAIAAKQYKARLITFSTDCVFSGAKGNYGEDDLPDAEDLYGKSKHLGEVVEENCLTIRTSIIGREIGSSNSLLEWFIKNRGGTVKGFKRAIFTGFPTFILAQICVDLIQRHPELQGVYHVSSDPISKFELLNLINKEFKLDIRVEPEKGFQIDRSLNSARFRHVTGFTPLRWEEMVNIMAGDPTPYENWRKDFNRGN